jgi:hypothetical protein
VDPPKRNTLLVPVRQYAANKRERGGKVGWSQPFLWRKADGF